MPSRRLHNQPTYTCELRPPYADVPPYATSHISIVTLSSPPPTPRLRRVKNVEAWVKAKGVGLKTFQVPTPLISDGLRVLSPLSIALLSLVEVEEERTRVLQLSLMAKRLAALFPFAFLLLLAASSPPIAAAKVGIKDDVSCTMCSSCDNPCQPAASPPPPPPSSSAECPPPPSSSGGIFYYSPPPPSSSGGVHYYSPPPPSSSSGGTGGSYYYPPPSNIYYPAPPPPNPFLPYFPFYYYSPPPPSKYHSGSRSLKPLSSIPLLFLLLFF